MTTFLDKLARSDEGDVYQALVTATGEGASFHQLFARAFLAKVFKECKRTPFDPVDPLHPLRRVMRGRWTFLSFFRDYPISNTEEKANLLEHFVEAFQLVAFFYDVDQQEYRPTFRSYHASLEQPDLLVDRVVAAVLQQSAYELDPDFYCVRFLDRPGPRMQQAMLRCRRKRALWPFALVRATLHKGPNDDRLLSIFMNDAICALIASYLTDAFVKDMWPLMIIQLSYVKHP